MLLAGGGSAVRHEEVALGGICHTSSPPLPLVHGVCSISGIVCFSRSGLQQDNGIPSETE